MSILLARPSQAARLRTQRTSGVVIPKRIRSWSGTRSSSAAGVFGMRTDQGSRFADGNERRVDHGTGCDVGRSFSKNPPRATAKMKRPLGRRLAAQGSFLRPSDVTEKVASRCSSRSATLPTREFPRQGVAMCSVQELESYHSCCLIRPTSCCRWRRTLSSCPNISRERQIGLDVCSTGMRKTHSRLEKA